MAASTNCEFAADRIDPWSPHGEGAPRPLLRVRWHGPSQVADPATSYTVAYRELLRKAEMLKDERAVRELREVGPPPYPDGRGYRVQRKWSICFEGADGFIFSMVGFALAAPVTRCAMSTTGSMIRMSVASVCFRKRARSTRERSPATSLFRCSCFRALKTSPHRRVSRAHSSIQSGHLRRHSSRSREAGTSRYL